MMMSEKSKQHVDSCRFCWMCHHICPVGNATGQERNTARARALGISLVNRNAIDLEEIMDNVYECATCGACVCDCTTGWDPVMFTKETRLLAALEGKLPSYILPMVENCINTGNPYGKALENAELIKAICNHENKTSLAFFLGADARYLAPENAVRAIAVMEKAGDAFTVLTDEPDSGASLDFLIGAAEEAKAQMAKCAQVLDDFATVVVFDPADAKVMKQIWGERGVACKAKIVTFTSYLADKVKAGVLKGKKDLAVAIQDPYQLARDLEETEELRTVVGAFATIRELHLIGKETVWAGNLLMAQYTPKTISLVAERRLRDAERLGIDTIVTASVGEYAALKSVDQNKIRILSLEELVLG